MWVVYGHILPATSFTCVTKSYQLHLLRIVDTSKNTQMDCTSFTCYEGNHPAVDLSPGSPEGRLGSQSKHERARERLLR